MILLNVFQVLKLVFRVYSLALLKHELIHCQILSQVLSSQDFSSLLLLRNLKAHIVGNRLNPCF